jgi:type I restriction enzyme, S subunit
MKNGWHVKTLGEIADVKGGKRVPKGYQLQSEPTDHPYVTVSDFTDDGTIDMSELRYVSNEVFEQISNYTISSQDLYVSIAGTIGKTGYVPAELNGANLTENACKLVLHPGTDRDFLYYFTKSDDFAEQAGSNTRTAAQPKLALERLKTIRVVVPVLPDQKRIVATLDKAFDCIATAKASAEKNLQNARALFESYLQSVFSQRGHEWLEKTLSELCAITSTLVDPRRKEYLDLLHVGAGNVEAKTGVFNDLKTAREEGLISGKFLFDETMVLYSKIRPYLMKVARPDFCGLCSADMYPLAPTPDQITRDYLFYLLLSKGFTDYAIEGSARAGMPKVNREHLFGFKTWLPPITVQKELSAKLDDLREETHRLESIYEHKLETLEALKKSLLHQAFTGNL